MGFQPEAITDSFFLKIDTTEPYGEYLKAWGSKKRKEIRYYKSKLAKEGDVKVEYLTGEIQQYFAEFMDIYSSRRSSEDQSDPFGRLPSLYDFLKNIIPRYSRHDWIKLSILKLNQTIIAYTYYLIFNHVIYYYMPTFLEEFSAYSPGKILLAELIKNAFEDPEIHEFNFMRGVYSYKLWYEPVREGYVKIIVNNPWSYRNKVLPFIRVLSRVKHQVADRSVA